MNCEALCLQLQKEGWSLDPSAVERQLLEAGVPLQPGTNIDQFRSLILNLDLKVIGTAALPDDINRCDSKKISGPHILQLVEAIDVSQPSLFQDAPTDRKNRLLRLRMTDGHRGCVGIEYSPLLGLKAENLIPGVKICVKNATVRVGVLLLEPKSIEIVGGRVDHLAEAWEVQQQYGGTATRTAVAAEGEAGEKPPLFKPFDPRSSKRGASGTAPASGTVELSENNNNNNTRLTGSKHGEGHSGQHAHRGRDEGGRRGGRGQRGGRGRSSADAGGGRGRAQSVHSTVAPGKELGSASNSNPPPPPPPPTQIQPPIQSTTPTPPTTQSAARQKMLDRLAAQEEHSRGRGRFGGGGGRRGRRGRYQDDDDADDGRLTLEEWEARQAASKNTNMTMTGQSQSTQVVSDEELARQLQRQLDIEDAQMADSGAHDGDDFRSSVLGMFTYGGEEREGGGYGGGEGGRGRGGGRRGRGGRRGHGRGRAR